MADQETYNRLKKWAESKETFAEGNRNHFVVTLAYALSRNNVDINFAENQLVCDYADRPFVKTSFTEKEIISIVNSAYHRSNSAKNPMNTRQNSNTNHKNHTTMETKEYTFLKEKLFPKEQLLSKIVSKCKSAKDTETIDMSISSILVDIQAGSVRGFITQLRSLDAEQYKKEKLDLPIALFSGKFSKRENQSLTEHSGLICIDIDNIENVETIREKLKADPYIFSMFVSPSGKGLKILIPIQPEAQDHSKNFEAIETYFSQNYAITIDKKCKDVARACFYSWDENLYIADNCYQFDYKTAQEEKKAANQDDIYKRFSLKAVELAGLKKLYLIDQKTYKELLTKASKDYSSLLNEVETILRKAS